MPRYFFNWTGSKERHEGVDLSNSNEARFVAILAAAEVMRDAQGEILPCREYHIVVSDEAGDVVCELKVQGLLREHNLDDPVGQREASPTIRRAQITLARKMGRSQGAGGKRHLG